MKRPRFNTLFWRLFVLMWATLILSHLTAFVLAIPLSTGGDSPIEHRGWESVATLPSLPPGGLWGTGPQAPRSGPPFQADAQRPPLQNGPPAPNGPPGDPQGLPTKTLWLDYALRALLIGVGAWIGARWLARPMQALSRAAIELPGGLSRGQPPSPINENRGTEEVRNTARVFNRMAERLQHQFDQRSLHMAAISHDLRTPLTRLRLRVERLQDSVALAAAADIREMDEMIDASLAVMREQSGGDGPSVVDLGALLQSLVDDLCEQGHPVELAELPSIQVRVHPASVRRIVGNLVGNAVRYGFRARLSVVQQADAVAVHVDDDGPGIPPDQMQRVFEPWVRLPDRPFQGGSGLGLAIAKDLVEREGGTLRLGNRPQGGLRATVTLPRS